MVQSQIECNAQVDSITHIWDAWDEVSQPDTRGSCEPDLIEYKILTFVIEYKILTFVIEYKILTFVIEYKILTFVIHGIPSSSSTRHRAAVNQIL